MPRQRSRIRPQFGAFQQRSHVGELAANWPAARLIEIWNGLPGEIQVRSSKIARPPCRGSGRRSRTSAKLLRFPPRSPHPFPRRFPLPPSPRWLRFPSRTPAKPLSRSSRCGDHGTRPDTTVAPQSPDVAPSEPGAKKNATRTKKAPSRARERCWCAREGSKTSQVIAMLKREGGTTLEEIMAEMGWLKHTTRAMLSAGARSRKNHGLTVTSERWATSGLTPSNREPTEDRFPLPPDSTPAAFLVSDLLRGFATLPTNRQQPDIIPARLGAQREAAPR